MSGSVRPIGVFYRHAHRAKDGHGDGGSRTAGYCAVISRVAVVPHAVHVGGEAIITCGQVERGDTGSVSGGAKAGVRRTVKGVDHLPGSVRPIGVFHRHVHCTKDGHGDGGGRAAGNGAVVGRVAVVPDAVHVGSKAVVACGQIERSDTGSVSGGAETGVSGSVKGVNHLPGPVRPVGVFHRHVYRAKDGHNQINGRATGHCAVIGCVTVVTHPVNVGGEAV